MGTIAEKKAAHPRALGLRENRLEVRDDRARLRPSSNYQRIYHLSQYVSATRPETVLTNLCRASTERFSVSPI